MEYLKSCGCILICEKKVLLVSSNNDHGEIFWGFPKGHQEKGEADFETAIREVKEEVGLDVEIVDEAPIKVCHSIKNNTAYKEIYLCLASPVSKEIVIQEDEINEAKWVPFDEADEYLKDYYAEAWHECLKRLESSFSGWFKSGLV